MKNILILVILFIPGLIAQEKDPDKILDDVKKHFSSVQDYEVDVKIKVDIDFIKAPVSEATIFYKQPDKIKIKSDKFAMLPREGINFSPLSLLKENYTAIYQGEEKLDGKNVSVVKVIPIGGHSDIVLNTFWIDQSRKIIRKIETTTKIAGTFLIDLKYEDDNDRYPLPSSIKFSFNTDQLNINKGMAGEMEPQKNTKQRKKSSEGKVFITYSNYKVNKGIPDTVFEEDKK
ncbi:MAG: hypothetical protein R6W90_02180 [Ignavibacteriaceae bacterium]